MGSEGFNQFFEAEYPGLVRALTVALGSREAAEDAAQEGFARCLDRWGRVSSMERPTAWVYVVGLRAYRRGLRRESLPVQKGPTRDEIVADSATDRVWAERVLARLPPRQRMALVLRFVVDMPLREVAEAMGCSLGTVKATIHQALTALRVPEKEVDAHAC